MAKPNRLKEVEVKFGPLDKVIPRLLAENNGQQKPVAELLEVSQATISTWLKANGYSARIVYERTGEQQTA